MNRSFLCFIFLLFYTLDSFSSRTDSTKHYLKVSYNFHYGFSTFNYVASHSYEVHYKSGVDRGYLGSIEEVSLLGQTKSHEVKIDVDLLYGVKFFSSCFYNSLQFNTPDNYGVSYFGNYNPNAEITYKFNEKTTLKTRGLCIGFGYNRNVKRILLDADFGLGFYQFNRIHVDRELKIYDNYIVEEKPEKSYDYLTSEWNLCIKSSISASFKIIKRLYFKTGFTYNYFLFENNLDRYNGVLTYNKFKNLRDYLFNAGITFTLK